MQDLLTKLIELAKNDVKYASQRKNELIKVLTNIQSLCNIECLDLYHDIHFNAKYDGDPFFGETDEIKEFSSSFIYGDYYLDIVSNLPRILNNIIHDFEAINKAASEVNALMNILHEEFTQDMSVSRE